MVHHNIGAARNSHLNNNAAIIQIPQQHPPVYQNQSNTYQHLPQAPQMFQTGAPIAQGNPVPNNGQRVDQV